jgi:hypothetical protein
MPIIQTVALCDIDIIEKDGVYEATEVNKRTVPAMLTNYSIEVGHRMGLLKGSLNADLINVMAAYLEHGGSVETPADGQTQDIPVEALRSLEGIIEDTKVTSVIYLGCIGANRNFELSYDDFLAQYNGDPRERLQTYFNLITALKSNDKAAFAKEFKAKTSSKTDSKKK